MDTNILCVEFIVRSLLASLNSYEQLHHLTLFAAGQTSDKNPNFTVHSYDFHTTGSSYRVAIKGKLKSSILGNPCAALCVYTTLPHSITTYRILYYDLKSAVPTLDPDFRQFVLDTFDLGLSLGDKGVESSPIIFVLRDVSAESVHEVGSEIGYEAAVAIMQVRPLNFKLGT